MISETENKKVEQALSAKDSDWEIPNECTYALIAPGLTQNANDAEDFIIGQDLLDKGPLQSMESEVEQVAEVMFEDFIDESPFSLALEGRVAEAGIPQEEKWREISEEEQEVIESSLTNDSSEDSPGFAAIDESELSSTDLNFLSNAQSFYERIHGFCQKWFETHDHNHTLSAEEISSLQDALLADREEVKKGIIAIENLLNRCILEGKLTYMQRIGDIKNSFYQCQRLLKRIEKQINRETEELLSDDEVHSLMTAEHVIDAPDLFQSAYFAPSKKTETTQKVEKKVKPKFANRLTKKKLQMIALVAIFLTVPLTYNFSLKMGQPQRISIDPYQYSYIVEMTKAYQVENNFVGVVDDSWYLLGSKKKEQIVSELYKALDSSKFDVVILRNPYGDFLASYALGHINIAD